MGQFLLELYSEEIPAGMQDFARQKLIELYETKLKEADLSFQSIKSFAAPMRLCLTIDELPKQSKEIQTERKGPRVGAPEKAVEGFLKASGLSSLDQCVIEEDKKGQFYVAKIEKKGQPTAHILASLTKDVIENFPWPKPMRWCDHSLKWVRPLHNILALFDKKPIALSVAHLTANDQTFGHRFLSPDGIKISDFKSYQEKLAKAHVILDPETRKQIILEQAATLAKSQGLELIDDKGLLEEVKGLVEWPLCLLGSFDEDFLDMPEEIITLALKKHQKCFSLKNKKTGKLSNHFLLVSNQIASDKGAAIINGNERVVRARLSDAKFFWDLDQKIPLEKNAEKLKKIIFQKDLGSVADRVARIEKLSGYIAGQMGANAADAQKAARLAKADLVTGTVQEAPTLQGVIGQYCAEIQGEKPAICRAIGAHYRPQGQGDTPPTAPLSICVALADKLDLLTSFWAIDETPTGSRDPFGLRRAALGVIRILVENKITLPLGAIFKHGHKDFKSSDGLLKFFKDRLSIYLRSKEIDHDVLKAVFHTGDDDLLALADHSAKLQIFLKTDDGAALKAGVKRALNILAIEEKKDKTSFDKHFDKGKLTKEEEKALIKALDEAGKTIKTSLKGQDYESALTALAKLRGPIDQFFEKIIVNDNDEKIRQNRLKLLSAVRSLSSQCADFKALEG